jgi:hypothetical protein
MSANGFLGGLLRRDADEDDGFVAHSSGEEIATTRRRSGGRGAPEEGHQPPPRGLTVERLAGAIADLPPDVPRESAVLIVRKTLDAAGVRLSEVDESTREQEVRLSHEIGLVEERQEELREKTQEAVRSLEEEIRKAQEAVRSLEEEIRKAREACDEVVAYEERKISRDRALLGEVRRVRAFFELPETEGEERAGLAEVEGEDAGPAEVVERPGPTERDARQTREPLDATKARRVRDFFGVAEEDAGPTEQGARQARGASDVGRRRISDAPFGPGADS